MTTIHSLNDLPASLREAIVGVDSASGLLCPACQGGRTGERSLGYRLEGFLGHLTCFRAGCGYRACVPVDGTAEVRAVAFKPRPYTGALFPPNGTLSHFLHCRYGLAQDTIDAYVKDSGHGTWITGDLRVPRAVYMPVLSPYGEDRGGVVRFLDGTKPKTISYLTTAHPKLAWYTHYTRPYNVPTVIVEDQLSAMRCKQLGYNGVALMGTQINDEKARELRRDAPTLLALDKDAFGKAVGYARRWPWMTPVLLNRDIKDSDDSDVVARLQQALSCEGG